MLHFKFAKRHRAKDRIILYRFVIDVQKREKQDELF